MKRTGPTKESTRHTIVALDKCGKERKEDVWRTLAEMLSCSSRARASKNLWELSKLSKKAAGKFMVVPGKVLGTGDAAEGMRVAALEFSESARKKIEAAKGKAVSLGELVKEKVKKSEILIAK
ncbi:MAG: 50S ribosomal protein L18e [Candidatus Diapherotrites archaeon]